MENDILELWESVNELKEDPRKEVDTCLGKVYRYRVNSFIGNDGRIENRDTFYPLKRLSCTGCETCSWFEEAFQEYLEYSGFPDTEGYPEDRSLYYLDYFPDPPDYFSGYSEDGEWRFMRVPNKTEKRGSI